MHIIVVYGWQYLIRIVWDNNNNEFTFKMEFFFIHLFTYFFYLFIYLFMLLYVFQPTLYYPPFPFPMPAIFCPPIHLSHNYSIYPLSTPPSPSFLPLLTLIPFISATSLHLPITLSFYASLYPRLPIPFPLPPPLLSYISTPPFYLHLPFPSTFHNMRPPLPYTTKT